MTLILPIHILAGSLGIVTGFIALFAAKGAPIHRRMGIVFFCVMLVMTSTGVVIAAVRGAAPTINIPAGLLTGYLVITGLTTVRPPSPRTRALTTGGMVLAFAVGCTVLVFGLEALAAGGRKQGMPAFPYFLFATLGILGGVGDLRMLRSEPLRGTARIARHLWRMSFALFVAALSFFIGQADHIPKPIRIPPLLALPPLTALVTMLYWVWRVRIRRRARGLVGVTTPGAV